MSFRGKYRESHDEDVEIVAVDSSGFYSSPVGMEEMYNCVGVVSVHEHNIYASHISPGHIGKEPESVMNDFQEGYSSFIVKGVGTNSDSGILETVKSKLEEVEETYCLESFTADLEGNIAEGFNYSTESPLI